MHLIPHEQERLMVHVAGDVARRCRERGLPLNYPEVMALLTTYVYEEARAGATVDSIMKSDRHVLTRGEAMDGLPEMIDNVWVEATFPDGTKLVTVHDPFEKLAEDEETKKNMAVYPGKIDLVSDLKIDLVPEPEVPKGEEKCVRSAHSRKVNSRGRPSPLSHGSSTSPATRHSSSSSCSSVNPDMRSNRNGFSC